MSGEVSVMQYCTYGMYRNAADFNGYFTRNFSNPTVIICMGKWNDLKKHLLKR